MNVSELERLAVNMNSEYDRDRVEAWEYFCDIAPYLVRRVIAAEKLVAQIKYCIAFRFDPNIGIELNRLEEALATYEATK